MPVLYGDGVHDDAPAIQKMLDSGICEVSLPAPKAHYSIGMSLKIHSGQTLRLPETAIIRLLPGSSCHMLTNAERPAHDIVITGGIWDYDNVNQAPNPIVTKRADVERNSHLSGDPNYIATYETTGPLGVCMSFDHITRFVIRDLTVKNPATFSMRMAYVTHFTVENIRFDQNLGNPTAENMDGIHVDGGCRYGFIHNIQGTCYDDIVALNADDCYDGPLSDIVVDGVFGADSLRGVRLLSTKSEMKNITVQNVYGTFYQNCIGLTYFFPRVGTRGKMSHITLKNIHGRNAPRRPEYRKGDNSYYFFSFVWVDGDIDVDSLVIDGLYRDEEIAHVETLKVCRGARIKTLSLMNVLQQNQTDAPETFFLNEGEIERLYLYNVDVGDDLLLDNQGTINKITKQ